MSQIIKALVSWPVLVVEALILTVIFWGVEGNWIAYFWLIVLVAVLIGELVNKLFSPRKQTVSNNIRALSIAPEAWDRVRFWAGIIMWLTFSVTLAVHFCVRLF